MSCIKGIRRRLAGLRETADSTICTELVEIILPARQNLMRIGLVTNVEYNLVVWKIHTSMKRHGKFNCTKIGGQMSAGLSYICDDKGSYLRSQLRKIGQIYILYVIFVIYSV